MRLFTALWPSPEAVEHLTAAIDALEPERVAEATAGLRKFRFTAAERWHLTLRFHGDDADPDRVTERLDRRMARLRVRPPRLRLAGTGSFRGVLWIGVRADAEADERALRGLVRAAGGDPHSFRAHLTVGRWAGGRTGRASVTDLLAGYSGPEWTADEITVVASDLREGAPRHTVVHRSTVTRG